MSSSARRRRSGPLPAALDQQRLLDDLARAEARIEGGRRVLEDELDLAPRRPSAGPRGARGSGPRTRSRPSPASSKRARQRASVDLPEPDSPTSASVVPAAIVRSTPSRAWTAPPNASRPRRQVALAEAAARRSSSAMLEAAHARGAAPARPPRAARSGSAPCGPGSAARTRSRQAAAPVSGGLPTMDVSRRDSPRRRGRGATSRSAGCRDAAAHGRPAERALLDDAPGVHHEQPVGERRRAVPRSWSHQQQRQPQPLPQLPSSARISARVVESSADVGSSATSSAGRQRRPARSSRAASGRRSARADTRA